MGSRFRETGFQSSCVTLANLLNLSEPQFCYLYNGDNYFYLPGICEDVKNEIVCVLLGTK